MSLEGGGDILCASDFELNDVDTMRSSRRRNLVHFQHHSGKANVAQDRQAVQTGYNLVQELEPFASKIGGLDR